MNKTSPLTLGAFGVLIAACSASSGEKTGRSADAISSGCTTTVIPRDGSPWPIEICNDDRGNFRATFEKFGGVESLGLPITQPYQSREGDWYQTFERVEMNSNFGQGCEEGRACVAHLGRWDLEHVLGQSIGPDVTEDCADPNNAPREAVRCIPNDFADQFHAHGGRELYGLMLTPVVQNCRLWPGDMTGECFWTERAKISRPYGEKKWQGELLGNKKLQYTQPDPPRSNHPPPPTPPEPTPVTAHLSSNTVYADVDRKSVFYDPNISKVITFCDAGTPGDVLDRLRQQSAAGDGDATPLVLRMPDGAISKRKGHRPKRDTGWKVDLYPEDDGGDAGFLSDLDVSGAFAAGFDAGKITCTGNFQLSNDGFAMRVKGFRVENGVLKQPDVDMWFDGQTTGETSTSCEMRQSSGPLIAWAGYVPVLYEVWVSLGLKVAVSKPIKIHARLGTSGGSFDGGDDGHDDNDFTFTPDVKLGVTFYKTLGTYVGADFVFASKQREGCTPRLEFGVKLKAGVELGLDFLPISKALTAEVSTDALGPFTMRRSSCD
jgi:hypothetical protein